MKKEKADAWVRQILGNTGSIEYEDAMAALRIAERNSAAGLFPTTGGAVSLMKKEDVDALFHANRGLFPKFRPQVPDKGGSQAKSLGDWYVAAIEQALHYRIDPQTLRNLDVPSAILRGIRPFALRHTGAMDGMLHTYHSSGVDWMRVHAYATKLYGAVPSVGQTPYWLSNIPEPLTVLAFTDATTRALARKPY